MYVSIGLYVVLAVVAFTIYSPALTRSIAAFDAGGTASSEFQRLAARTRQVGMLLGVLTILLVITMVVKPGS